MENKNKKYFSDLLDKLSPYKWWLVLFFTTLIVIANIIFVKLIIPHEFTLATGDINGNYYKNGYILKEELEKKGIKVNLVKSRGSINNLELLKNKTVDMAFVQSGTIKEKLKYSELRGVTGLYNEPVFLFYKKGLIINSLVDLKGKNVSIGEIGSGTMSLVKDLFSKNNVNEDDINELNYSYAEAKKELVNGKIDAAFFVISLESKLIKDLIKKDNLTLFSFKRYDTYQYYFPKFSSIKIPQGYYDLSKNIPKKEKHLVTAVATIVCREDTHPRLVDALMLTIHDLKEKERVEGRTIESKQSKFPTKKFLDFELHRASEVFFRDGPSFLTKYFEYNVVFLLSRLKFILIPLIPFLILFIKVAPGIIKLKGMLLLKKKYKSLHKIERYIKENHSTDNLNKAYDMLEMLKISMDEESEKIPPQQQKDIYNWKLHHSFLQIELEEKINKIKTKIV